MVGICYPHTVGAVPAGLQLIFDMINFLIPRGCVVAREEVADWRTLMRFGLLGPAGEKAQRTRQSLDVGKRPSVLR